jgi:CBS domain-containing protein
MPTIAPLENAMSARSARRVQLPRPREEVGAPVTAAAVMRPPALVVEASAPPLTVWTLLQRSHGDLAVVTDGGRYLGLVHVHDLWVSWACDLTGSGTSLHRLVALTPAVDRRTPLDAVCRSLLASRHGAVLVVDERGALEGVITSADVVRLVSAGSPSC